MKASDILDFQREKFLIYGNIGSGKSTMFRTLPGKKFLYIFDPAGLTALKSTDDIEFEMYLPETVPMSVVSLRKRGEAIITDTDVSYKSADCYKKFEKDFMNRLDSHWFQENNIDVIGFDSLTTLSDIVMDQILELNRRPGKFPEQDDWTVQMNTLQRIVRNATSTGCYIYFTAHEEVQQDKLMRTISNEIMVTGKLKKKLPILFSDIYHARATRDGDKVKYLLETAPDEYYPTARCSLQLPPTIDVTLKPNIDPTLQGLGGILRSKHPDRFVEKGGI